MRRLSCIIFFEDDATGLGLRQDLVIEELSEAQLGLDVASVSMW